VEDEKHKTQLVSPSLIKALWKAVEDSDANSRSSIAALGALTGLLYAVDWKKDPYISIIVVQAMRDANAGSQARSNTFVLAKAAVENGGLEHILAAGLCQEVLGKLSVVKSPGLIHLVLYHCVIKFFLGGGCPTSNLFFFYSYCQ